MGRHQSVAVPADTEAMIFDSADSRLAALIAGMRAALAGRRQVRVGVDLDGCCYDFDGNFARYLLSVGYPAEKMVEVTNWWFYRDWGLSDAEFVAACIAGVQAGILFRSGGTLPGAAWALDRLMRAGHEVHIITARGFDAVDASGSCHFATREWLADESMPYTSLTLSHDKTSVSTDVMVEDNLDNYDALDAAGVHVLLINRPWNHVAGGDERRRITDVAEFARIVLAATA